MISGQDSGEHVSAQHVPEGTEPSPDVERNMQLVQAACNTGMTPQEAEAYDRMKRFCSNLVKKLAPPLLKEVQASTLRPEAEPYTPRRTTRAAKRAPTAQKGKATPAENVLMRALGLALEDLEVDDAIIDELNVLFDSPLRE